MKGAALEKILAIQDAIAGAFEKQGELYRDSMRDHGVITPAARARYKRLDDVRSRLMRRLWRLVSETLTPAQERAFDAAWDARRARRARAYQARERLRNASRGSVRSAA